MVKKSPEKRNEPPDIKQLTLRLPSDLHLKLKLKCVKEGKAMGEVLTEAVRKFVEGD